MGQTLNKKSPQAIRDAARRLVEGGGATQRQLSEKSGINPPQLSRFLGRTDEKGLAPDKLAALEATVAELTPRNLTLPESHLGRLADKLRDGQLALFVGAGLSHLAPRRDGGPRRLPLWTELAREVAQTCHIADPDGYRDPLDLFDAVVFGDGDRPDLVRAIRMTLDDSDYLPSVAHEALNKLPWQAVLTTNYDGLLQRLLNQRPVAEERDYDRLSDRTPPRLFHVHGTLDHPHTLTREDYRLWVENHPRAWHHLKELLLNKTVLFVGYSLSDPHLDTLLAAIRQITKGRNKRVYAWMWRIADGQQQLLDRRDNIEALSFRQEGDWARAFDQLHEAYQQRVDAEPTAAVPAPTGEDPFAYDREQYLAAVTSRYGEANVHALYLPGAGYARNDVLLAEIFTEPDLEPVEPRRPEKKDEAAGSADSTADDDSLQKLRLREKASLRHRSGQGPREGRRRPATELLQSESRLTILGAPGQGKSTLLRHWLLATAEQWRSDPGRHAMPVYIRLADWEAGIMPGDGRLRHYLASRVPRIAEVSSRAATCWQESPILWLLDGVDEIRDPHERQRLRDEVRTLAGQRPSDRWVVASRPANYPAGGMGADWTITKLPPLTPPQVVSVLEKWSHVLARKEGLALDPHQLAEALEREPGLRRIRGNALLLTLAVLFYKALRKLPQDRWEFYDHAERALRDQWVRHRMAGADAHLPGKYLGELLEALALKGMSDGVVSFSRRTLEAEAEQVLHRWGYVGRDLDSELTRLVRAAEDLIGVLVAQGPDRFGFLHLTFQEFYAARALVKRTANARRWIAQYWDHPDWEEVWALYALGIGDDQERLDQLLETILDNSHSLDAYLHRPHLTCLGLAGVGDHPLPTGSTVWKGVETWAADSVQAAGYRMAATLSVLSTWEKSCGPILRRALLQRLHDKEREVREAVVWALSPQADDPTVRQDLIQALGDQDRFVRRVAAKSLALQACDPTVQESLFQRLSDEDPGVRREVAQALASHADDPTVQQTLLQRLASDNEHLRQAVLWALARLADRPTIKQALLRRLDDDDRHVRRAAAQVLAPHSNDPTVQQALLARLGDQDRFVRHAVARLLAPYASDTAFQHGLLQRLEEGDSYVRQSVPWALIRQANDPTVKRALLLRLDDENGDVRDAVANVLASQGDDPVVQEALLQRLNDEDSDTKGTVAWALARHGGNVAVEHALYQYLDDDNNDVRGAAVDSLTYCAGDPSVRKVLLQRLNDPSETIRRIAVEALAPYADNLNVRQGILQHLDDEHSDVRWGVALALAPLAGDPVVRQALLRHFDDSDGIVRWSVAEALGSYAGDAVVQHALLQRLDDEVFGVREAVVEALERWIFSER